jgi:predicted nucleic acid-binding protein
MVDGMKKAVYIETSIVSYLTARPSRDVRASAWQQLTHQWWNESRPAYEVFTSELVVAEATGGDSQAAERRLEVLAGIPELPMDEEVRDLAARLLADGGMPAKAEADALHVAVAAVQSMDYLLTWNCRHIDNAATKPVIRSICAVSGTMCPEICTPMELLSEDDKNDVS